MAAGAQAEDWTGESRRRTARFQVRAPVDVIVQRAGHADTVPGRTLNVGDCGVAAILAGELPLQDVFEIEVQLPGGTEPFRASAKLCYQEDLRCGFEFVGLTAEQQSAIQNWAKETKAQPETATPSMKKRSDPKSKKANGETGPPGGPPKKRSALPWIIVLIALSIGAGVFWWKWNRGWQELESGLRGDDSSPTQKPEAMVPADVMQKLIIHRVEPVYPPDAKKQGIEGVIAIDIVVGRDGSVLSMHPLNGPEVLARAAMEALRWWKFEPYRIAGQPAVVGTTMAVEFKR
jgi:TonB family protein